jgi:HD-GYP domain-containing protein (c-di-GMP phosphodiesterase class II)
MEIQFSFTFDIPQTSTNCNIPFPTIVKLSNQYVNSLFQAITIRDHETKGHTIRVTRIALNFARHLGFKDSDLINIQTGCILHDIGKLGVSDYILNKKGILTDEEMGEMKKHPSYARQILSSITVFSNSLDIPYYHHEKWDGTGYPEGLIGEDIPIFARLFAVVDVWDALLSDRPYRKAWKREDAESYIHQQSGRHFEPMIVGAFFEFIKKGVERPNIFGNLTYCNITDVANFCPLD